MEIDCGLEIVDLTNQSLIFIADSILLTRFCRLDHGDAVGWRIEMPGIERQEHVGSGTNGGARNNGVVRPATADAFRRQLTKQRDVGRAVQCHHDCLIDKIRFNHRPRVGRAQSMRSGQPRQHGICFDERVGGDGEAIAALEASFYRHDRRAMMLVPRADGRDHAAGIERDSCHVSARADRGDCAACARQRPS
jgi:hypothetical protein